MHDDILRRLDGIDESIKNLTAGLTNQALTLAYQSTVLAEILGAVAEREDGDDSLGSVLRRLVAVSEMNAASIGRIEKILERVF